MAWFKVDDKLHGHRKPRAAGKAAMGVWVLAGSWAADHGTDGFVPASYLPLWGTRGDAKRLVDAGLWHPHEKYGERGWLFHNWAEFQPSAAQVEEERAKARRRMQRIRSGERSPEHSANVQGNVRRTFATPSRPEGSVTEVSPLQDGEHATDGLTDRLSEQDFETLRARLGTPSTHFARQVAGQVLARSQVPVANPLRYVLAAVDAEPERYRPTPGPVRKSEECPIHVGKPADACGGCAADARVVDR